MHERVAQVGPVWFLIGCGTEAGERHLMQVDPQRVHSVKEHVQTQVVLQIFNQVGVGDILLHDILDFCGVESLFFE